MAPEDKQDFDAQLDSIKQAEESKREKQKRKATVRVIESPT